MSGDNFAALRELLSQNPSIQGFQDIISLFESWNSSTLNIGIAYASQHLQTWPPEYCKLTTSKLMNWWPSMPEGTAHPAVALIRSLDLWYNDALAWNERATEEDHTLNHFQRVDFKTVLTSPHIKHLKEFHGSEIYSNGEYGTSGSLPPLERMILWNCELQYSDVLWLLNSLQHPLKELRLSHNQLNDECVHALITSPYTQALEWLDLEGTGLTEENVAQITNAPFARTLQHLGLECSMRTAQTIASSPNLSRLKALHPHTWQNTYGVFEILGMGTKLPKAFRQDYLERLHREHIASLAKLNGISTLFKSKNKLLQQLLNQKR